MRVFHKRGKPLRGARLLGRLIGASCDQACYRDILIQVFPMKTQWADFEFLSLFCSCGQQAGEPGKRDAERSSIVKDDPHAAVVKVTVSC